MPHNTTATQETPLFLSDGAADDALIAAAIAQYNAELASSLANFTLNNANVTANIVNTTTPFQTVIDDPTAYGAPNATCYDSDGTTCIWYNDYHPGVASKYKVLFLIPLWLLRFHVLFQRATITDDLQSSRTCCKGRSYGMARDFFHLEQHDKFLKVWLGLYKANLLASCCI